MWLKILNKGKNPLKRYRFKIFVVRKIKFLTKKDDKKRANFKHIITQSVTTFSKF